MAALRMKNPTPMRAVRRAIRVFGATCIAFYADPTEASSQLNFDLPAHYYFYEGCYTLERASKAGWLDRIETDVHLTLTRLEWDTLRRFVVRAAPGTEASWYPKVYWLLVGNVGPLHLAWEWPGFDWLTMVFPVEGWDGESPLVGEAIHNTDEWGYSQILYPCDSYVGCAREPRKTALPADAG